MEANHISSDREKERKILSTHFSFNTHTKQKSYIITNISDGEGIFYFFIFQSTHLILILTD